MNLQFLKSLSLISTNFQAVNLSKRLRRLHFNDPYLQNQVRLRIHWKKMVLINHYICIVVYVKNSGKLFRLGNLEHFT